MEEGGKERWKEGEGEKRWEKVEKCGRREKVVVEEDEQRRKWVKEKVKN